MALEEFIGKTELDQGYSRAEGDRSQEKGAVCQIAGEEFEGAGR